MRQVDSYAAGIHKQDALIQDRDSYISALEAKVEDQVMALRQKGLHFSERDAYIQELEARLGRRSLQISSVARLGLTFTLLATFVGRFARIGRVFAQLHSHHLG